MKFPGLCVQHIRDLLCLTFLIRRFPDRTVSVRFSGSPGLRSRNIKRYLFSVGCGYNGTVLIRPVYFDAVHPKRIQRLRMRMPVGIVLAAADDRAGRTDSLKEILRSGRTAAMMSRLVDIR